MPQKPVIKVGHIKITDHLALGVTQDKVEKGETTFEHFDLETQFFVGWNALGVEFRNGDLDAAFILAPYAMELFHSGVKANLVLFGHRDGSIIIKNKNANIETIQDFKGKTVLIPHFLSVHNMLFERMLRENGLEVGVGKDVTFEVIAPSQIPQAMEWDENGSIGGFIVAEPFGSQVVKAGYGEEFALSKDVWPHHPCCVVVVKEDIIQQHPEAVQELVDSLVESGNFIEQETDAAAQVGAGFLGQEVNVIKRVLNEPKDRVSFNKMLPTLDELDLMQTYLTGNINAMSDKIDLESFVITQFAQTAGAQ